MRIHIAGRDIEPVSCLLAIVLIWGALTVAAALIVFWTLGALALALVNLPMALWRRVRA